MNSAVQDPLIAGAHVGANTLSYADFHKSIATMYEKRCGREVATALADILIGDNLQKSLVATGTIPVDGTSGADATKLEDVFNEVVSTELDMKRHAVIWNDLQKVPVHTDPVQKVNMNSYGGGRRLGFINPRTASGGVLAQDPNLLRAALTMGFVGGRFQTFTNVNVMRTLGLNVDPMVGNADELNSEARLQRMVLNANELTYHGDSVVNPLEADGVIKQIRDKHTKKKPTRINLNGSPIDRKLIPDIRDRIRLNAGDWNKLYMAPTAFSSMTKELIEPIRYTDGAPTRIGIYTNEALIRDLGGNPSYAQFREDDFLEPLGLDSDTSADPDAPSAPGLVTVDIDSGAALNVWDSYLTAATYYYSVKAVGINGRSIEVAATTSAVVGAHSSAVLTITNADANTCFFEIYRGTATTARNYLNRVGATGVAVGATVTFTDDGEFIPNTTSAVALTIRPYRNGSSIHICQLIPVTKVGLPNNLMAQEAGWICGFTPRVMNEEHCVILENIGAFVG